MGKELKSMQNLKSLYGRPETEFLDTGNFLLNDIMGGGLPTGKFVEFHGLEGTGKTTIIVQALKHMIQSLKIKVVYMDVEAALTEALRESIGIDKFEGDDPEEPSFLYICPGTYPEIARVLAAVLESSYTLVIWDSVANSSVDINTDDDKDVISKKLGQDALEQTNLMKAFKNKFGRHGKTLICIQQMRTNINLNSYIRTAPYKPAGGKAYDHNLDIRVAISKGKWIEDTRKERIGAELALLTIKNKVTMPFKRVDADLYFGKGIDKTAALMEVMIKRKIAVMGGSFFKISGIEHDKIHGKDQLKTFVRSNYKQCLQLVGDVAERVNVDLEPMEE